MLKKQKDLLHRILESERVYADQLGDGDKVRAKKLEDAGLIVSGSGTWSGKKYYTGS